MRETIKRHIRTLFVAGVVLGATVAGVTMTAGDGAEADPGPRIRGDRHQPGDPLPGLSPELATLFHDGRAQFEHELTPSEGLGPVYNERACQTCHGGIGAAAGGPDPVGLGSQFNVFHFGYDNHNMFDPMRELGGPVRQHRDIRDVAPGCPIQGEDVPAQANVVSERHTPAVWGFGLIDAIPDAEILQYQNLGVDGIRGVANWGREMQARAQQPTAADPQLSIRGQVRVGRFGWKAQTATLAMFTFDPNNIELGMTNPFFPQEFTPTGLQFGEDLPAECQVADHAVNDVDGSVSFSLYHFQALVSAPPRLPIVGEAAAGELHFGRIGCVSCHRPTMRTGEEYWLQIDENTSVRVPQLENQDVHLYSDLLTHDMGDALADNGGATIGRVMARADGRRWRTTPLWGLRFKRAFLHDGRTDDVREAILLHGGEASVVRDRFAALPRAQQDEIIEFLLRI